MDDDDDDGLGGVGGGEGCIEGILCREPEPLRLRYSCSTLNPPYIEEEDIGHVSG